MMERDKSGRPNYKKRCELCKKYFLVGPQHATSWRVYCDQCIQKTTGRTSEKMKIERERAKQKKLDREKQYKKLMENSYPESSPLDGKINKTGVTPHHYSEEDEDDPSPPVKKVVKNRGKLKGKIQTPPHIRKPKTTTKSTRTRKKSNKC